MKLYAIFWIVYSFVLLFNVNLAQTISPSFFSFVHDAFGNYLVPLGFFVMVIISLDLFRLRNWGKYATTVAIIISYAPEAEPWPSVLNPWSIYSYSWLVWDALLLYLLWIDKDVRDEFPPLTKG